MDQVHVIRHKVLVEGLSLRRVAREMGVSRNTVKKYLGQSEPRRVEQSPRAQPVLEVVQPRIDELLEEWRGRTTRKQRVTATRVHRQLLGEGYDVGITLVRDYLREVRRRRAEVYIPLVHRPGDEAQVDFFEVTLDVAGQRRKAWMFLMRLMFSGRDFVWFYDRCDQVSFLDGHVRAFDHFEGAPHRCVYDNLSAAVRKVVLPKRDLTQRFKALTSHYLFEPCFARPGVGHDKGGVESRGKAIRLQLLTPIPQGPSLQHISEQLVQRLDDGMSRRRSESARTIADLFGEEQALLLPLPSHPFEARKAVSVSISRRSRAKVEGAWYSVPSHWAQLEAMAYIGPEDVRLVCRGEEEVYERQPFGRNAIRYRHYLPELAKKPQAVRQVAPELLAELGEPFGTLWRLLVDTYGPADAGRIFARVIGVIVDHGESVVAEAVQRAMDADRLDVIGLLPPQRETPQHVAVPEALSGYQVEAARAADFDHLLMEASDD